MDQPTTDQMPSQPMLGQEDMLELVRRQQAGNVSIRAFCEHHHIAQSKFYYWRRKYGKQKEQENDTGFALLQPQHTLVLVCRIVRLLRLQEPASGSTNRYRLPSYNH